MWKGPPDVRYAILKPNGIVQQCGRQRWLSWPHNGYLGRHPVFKRDPICDELIETVFDGECLQPDGPPRFWVVRITPYPSPTSHNQILSAIRQDLDALPSSPAAGIRRETRFETKEDALRFHQTMAKALRLQARERAKKKLPRKDQELITQLRTWCGRKWGRQSQVSQKLGVSPQAVCDWLAGRKNMTGHQALLLEDLLSKALKRDRPES